MGSQVSTLEFRVLGPLEMMRDGRRVTLGGERQRALLALLLVRANQLVTVSELIEQLFGADPSTAATNSVHVAISRLRRLLRAQAGGPRLLTRPGGYTLELDPAQLDAVVFEQRVRRGRELLGEGDAAAAVAELRAALALWRGAALADVAAAEFLAPEARRLEELRLLATMDWIDAELATGHHAELIPEVQRLVAANPLRERLRGQLMLALYRSGRQAEALAAYREAARMLRDQLGLDPGPALRELEQLVLHQDATLEVDVAQPPPVAAMGAAGDATGPSPPPLVPVCPFKGLAFFDGADADYFCGRGRLVGDLVARMAEWPLVGIVGASGIGKSSLLRAGLLPALAAGALPGSRGASLLLLRPGPHPHVELTRAAGPGGLDALLAELDPGRRVVIAVDQLEEVFTVCREERERRAFLAALADAAQDPGRHVSVVCALRADFYGRLANYPAFARLLSQSHLLVGPMDRDELAEAVREPSARAGLHVEPELVDALVSDVVDEPGGLPLLSSCLMELWLARDGRTLTLGAYRATGGVRSAVARLAESAYLRLGDGERRIASGLLLRLASDHDGALTRRRVPLSELHRVDGADRVVASLIDARLLTAGDGAVELSHEALLREWPRYRGWLEEDQVGRRLHAHLTESAGEWESRGRDAADLYRGARLATALDWAGEHRSLLSRTEREFLAAGRTHAEQETRRQRSQNRRLRGLLVGTAVLLVISLLAGVLAIVKQHDAAGDARLAAAEARSALGRQLSAEALGEPRIDVAMLLAREAVNLDRSPATEGTLLSTLLRSPAVTGTFALPTASAPALSLSPDGRTLAVADDDAGTVRFYDTATHRMLRPPLTDFSGSQPPAYSGDGSLLAYPAGAAVEVRDARTVTLQARLPFDSRFDPQVAGQPAGGSLLLSPDDRSVYFAYWLIDAAGRPAQAYLDSWSLPAGGRPLVRPLGRGAMLAIRLSADGTRLTVVRPDTITIYDTRSLAPLRSLAVPQTAGSPSIGALSPDARTAALGTPTGGLQFVDLATATWRRGAGTQGAAVRSLAFTPDGDTVVSIGDDDRVVVWNPVTGLPATSLSGPVGQVQDAAVDGGGRTLYTASLNGVVLAWDLGGANRFGRRSQIGVPPRCCEPLSPRRPPMATTGSGRWFAAALGASHVGVFSMATLRRRTTLTLSAGMAPVTALAWSPDGTLLAVAGRSGVVELWNLAGAPRLARSLTSLRFTGGLPAAIQSLAFSPDGSQLAASVDVETPAVHETAALPLATMAVWQTDTGALASPIRDLGPGNGPGGADVLAFSPGGRWLAVSLLHGGVLVLDAASGRLHRRLVDPGDDVISLAFAPDGTLATGTLAGTVYLWNPGTGARLAPPLVAATAPVAAITFDPRGQRFATGGYQDGSVRLWSTATLQPEGPALPTAPGASAAIAFSAADDLLLVDDDRGTAFTWPMSLRAWEQRACTVGGRNLTRAEWSRLVGGLPYATACP